MGLRSRGGASVARELFTWQLALLLILVIAVALAAG